MSWFWLVLAGICEVGWPLGLKLASNPAFKIWGPALALVSMTFSGIFLWLSLKGIPIGTAYAVWTSMGAVGTFLVGVYFFNDPQSLLRWLGVALIVAGVVVLKLSS
jgi:quaternary ammonium compound-resistance protein SugE